MKSLMGWNLTRSGMIDGVAISTDVPFDDQVVARDGQGVTGEAS